METLSLIGNAFAGMMNPMSILLLIVGVAVGIVFGSIPGLSAAMAVALFLPVTFAMQAHEAFTLLVALYIGGISGGLISAILINIPGTSSSIATCFDGSPMAKKGEAGKALGTGVVFSFLGGLFSFLLNLMTVVMTTYYISAAGPKLRRSFCQWLAPNTQRRFLLVWTVAQGQISSFLFSRSILALINATCTAIFLEILHVPYWLPLALFCGVVSQFIPTVGTYIGGALPVLFAWGNRGWTYAVAVLVFIIVYQQIENLILSPRISQRTMDINAAVAFLAVLAFGSLFGAFGAFLALPVTASLQAIFRAYTKRYELIDSPLMNDPTPEKKSKIVEASEAFGEHVLQPIGEHMPRAAKGSTSRVPMNEELRLLQEQIYAIPPHETKESDLDDSATVAIPQRGAADTQQSEQPEQRKQTKQSDQSASSNPRAGWR